MISPKRIVAESIPSAGVSFVCSVKHRIVEDASVVSASGRVKVSGGIGIALLDEYGEGETND